MSDDRHEDGKGFLLTYPCYVIVLPPYQITDDGGIDLDKTGMLLSGMIHGIRCTPVFTDQDLAVRFAESHGLPASAVIAELPAPAELASILRRLRRKGQQAEAVAFDPSDSFRGFLVSLRDIPGVFDSEP